MKGRLLVSECERPGCTVRIEQLDGPGRKRRYCSSACRQATHRMRQRQPQPGVRDWIRALDRSTR